MASPLKGSGSGLEAIGRIRTHGAVGGLMDKLIGDHIQQHLAQPDLIDAERAEAADDILAAIRRYAR